MSERGIRTEVDGDHIQSNVPIVARLSLQVGRGEPSEVGTFTGGDRRDGTAEPLRIPASLDLTDHEGGRSILGCDNIELAAEFPRRDTPVPDEHGCTVHLHKVVYGEGFSDLPETQGAWTGGDRRPSRRQRLLAEIIRVSHAGDATPLTLPVADEPPVCG